MSLSCAPVLETCLNRNGAVFSRKMVKIDFFEKIVDFGPKTLLMTKNDPSIAIIKEKTICGVKSPLKTTLFTKPADNSL